MAKVYKIKAKVWKWPGDGPWHFVTLGKELSKEIKEKYGKGMIRIKTTIGKTTWENVLFPHKLSQSYILAVKKLIRHAEGILEGDEIKTSFIIKSPEIRSKK
jgi:hypothetical protein